VCGSCSRVIIDMRFLRQNASVCLGCRIINIGCEQHCVNKRPEFSRTQLRSRPHRAATHGIPAVRMALLHLPSVRVVLGEPESPVPSAQWSWRAANPCHACAHIRSSHVIYVCTSAPAHSTCTADHFACISHAFCMALSRQDQRCHIRDAITRCRASAPGGRGTESHATLHHLHWRARYLRW
jgi:hypothetical protein